MEGKKLVKRQEVPVKYKWSLEEIYADDSLWEKDYIKITEMLLQVQEFKNKLGESPNHCCSA